jgi:hypothetical protein
MHAKVRVEVGQLFENLLKQHLDSFVMGAHVGVPQ